MLNYVAFYLISFMLRTPGSAAGAGVDQPAVAGDAALRDPAADLLGSQFSLNVGFLLVIAATFFCAWLLNRSSLGFRFRAVGENPSAARTAGIDVKGIYIWAMVLSGALVGIAGATQVLGTLTTGFSSGIDAGIGFDAITVALLGRSRPGASSAPGILFGALKAGGYAMQARERRADRHRARRAVADRAVRRGAAARAHDLPDSGARARRAAPAAKPSRRLRRAASETAAVTK